LNKPKFKLAVSACLLSALSLPAYATNGFNLIGFGAESTLMGGADVAVARDTSALNTNPAGLTQISGQLFNGFGSVLQTLDLSHQDQLNDQQSYNRFTPLAGFGYARSLENIPCTVGIGFFTQGGAGGVFEKINTVFGTNDRFSALLGFAKLTPGIGCKINDQLSVGISFGLVYSSVQESLFPDTSTTQFFGLKLADASTLKTTLKIGAQYRATPQLTLAAAYTDKTSLPMTGGNATFDMTSIGLGKVNYRDATYKGIALPREIALGAAFQATDDLLLSLKLNWINWGNAMHASALTATDPDNSAAAAQIYLPSAIDWKNQWVIATGLAYQLDDKVTLYGGFNYGKNPIPEAQTSPFLAGILEQHYTLGAAYKMNPEWTFTGGLEYDPRVVVNYNNTSLPFAANTQLRNEALFLHFMFSRQW